jgi:hypothetical protein
MDIQEIIAFCWNSFSLPKKIFSKEKSAKDCGSGDCGCH